MVESMLKSLASQAVKVVGYEWLIIKHYLNRNPDETVLFKVFEPVSHTLVDSLLGKKRTVDFSPDALARVYEDGLVHECVLNDKKESESIADTYKLRKMVLDGKVAWVSNEQRLSAIRLYLTESIKPLERRAKALGTCLVRIASDFVNDSVLSESPFSIGIFLEKCGYNQGIDDTGWVDYGDAMVGFLVNDGILFNNKSSGFLDVIDNLDALIENPELLFSDNGYTPLRNTAYWTK